jgi:hypothetical protein
MMTTTATKELIVMSGAIKGAVDVSQTSTLKNVRASILREFDDDMLPCEDFCFYINDIRISQKQEALKMVWAFVQEVPVSIHPKQGNKRALNLTNEGPSAAHLHLRKRFHRENDDLPDDLPDVPVSNVSTTIGMISTESTHDELIPTANIKQEMDENYPHEGIPVSRQSNARENGSTSSHLQERGGQEANEDSGVDEDNAPALSLVKSLLDAVQRTLSNLKTTTNRENHTATISDLQRRASDLSSALQSQTSTTILSKPKPSEVSDQPDPRGAKGMSVGACSTSPTSIRTVSTAAYGPARTITNMWYTLIAPPGLLGLYIDFENDNSRSKHHNQNHNHFTRIAGIDKASPFNGKVSVGDYVHSIDGQNVSLVPEKALVALLERIRGVTKSITFVRRSALTST